MVSEKKTLTSYVRRNIFIFGICLLAMGEFLLYAWHTPNFMDETSFLVNARTFVIDKTIVPIYTRYPTFYSYLITLPFYLTYRFAYPYLGFPSEGMFDHALFSFLFEEHLEIWTWSARITTMLFSLGLLIIVLRWARRKMHWSGVVAMVLFFVLDPFGTYITFSSYGLADIPMAFFAAASMFLCLRFLELRTMKYYYWASVIAGLAASTKLNGALMLAPLLTTPWLVLPRPTESLKICGKAVLLFLAGFFIGTPALIFSFQSYRTGIIEEADILFGSGAIGFHDRPWIWVWKIAWNMNPMILSLLTASIISSFLKRQREDILFLSIIIPSILILGALQKKYIVYFMVIYPVLGWQLGRFVSDLSSKIAVKWIRIMFSLVIIAAFVPSTIILRAKLSRALLRDNREIAQEWIHGHIPQGTSIILQGRFMPWLFGDQNTLYYWSVMEPQQNIRKVNVQQSKYGGTITSYLQRYPVYRIIHFREIEFNYELLDNVDAEYLILSSYHYSRILRAAQNTAGLKNIIDDQNAYGRIVKRDRFCKYVLSNESKFKIFKTFNKGSGPIILIYKSS